MIEELEALEGQTLAVDAATVDPLAVAAPGQELAPAGPDYGLEARATVDTFAALMVGYSPRTAPLWDDDSRQRIGAALAPVMEKYGFTLGAMPPELTLIIVAGPVLYQSAKIVGEDIAQKKAEAAKKRAEGQGQQAQTPAAPAGTPEQVRHPQETLYQ